MPSGESMSTVHVGRAPKCGSLLMDYKARRSPSENARMFREAFLRTMRRGFRWTSAYDDLERARKRLANVERESIEATGCGCEIRNWEADRRAQERVIFSNGVPILPLAAHPELLNRPIHFSDCERGGSSAQPSQPRDHDLLGHAADDRRRRQEEDRLMAWRRSQENKVSIDGRRYRRGLAELT